MVTVARSPRPLILWASVGAILLAALLVAVPVLFDGPTYDSTSTIPEVPDADGDGLDSDIERSGWRTQVGDVFTTDPYEADTDGDGLTDGEEAGAVVTDPNFGAAHIGLSDPRLPDTDGDGVGDADEYLLDMNPRLADTDEDGLLDALELEFDSDPTLADADGDDYDDSEEYDRRSDPLGYDLDRSEAAEAFLAGAGAGVFLALNDAQRESTEYLVGQLAGGAVGLGDVLSLADSIRRGDFAGAMGDAVGLAPGAGDAVKIGEKLAAFALKSERAARVARVLVQKLPLPKQTKEKLLLRLAGGLRLPAELDGGPAQYDVYVGLSPTSEIVYCGITKDVDRRQAQHGGRFAITPIAGASGLSRGEARAIEEACIRTHGDALENKIHSISPGKPYYDDAVEWGEDWLSVNGFAA